MKIIEEKAKEILRRKYSDFDKNEWHYKSELEMLLQMSEIVQRWIPIEEELPETYNCQILVKKGNENFCDLRFFHHEEQFKLLCSIHKYTHWRLIS